MEFKKTVVFDFDGVIHSYTSGWKGAEDIPDPPVPGISEAIERIRMAGYRVVVVSTRCYRPEGMGAVRRYLRDNSAIRVSRSIRDVAYRVLQCKEALTTRLGREPTLEEISKELDIPLEEVSRALDAVCAPASLYDPVYSDGGDALTVMDQVRDTKNTEDGWMEHITLQNAFRALNDREKQILSLRFYDGKTQMEVASALGISQAQVSRLEKGAIGAMRKSVSVS